MSFETQKQQYLKKLEMPDNSKKGSIDKQIKPLVDAINSLPNFYTTSSCAGRIVLLKESESGKKNEVEWLFTSHKTVKSIKIKEFPKETVWLRQESAIIHVCAKTEQDAVSLLNIAKKAGFKRAGIISLSSRIIIEIMGTERMDAPISKNNKLLITEDYFDFLIKLANKKLLLNRSRLKKLEEEIKKIKINFS